MSRMNAISNLEKDVRPMDLIRLALPATIHGYDSRSGGEEREGFDYAAGFYMGIHFLGADTKFVALSPVQKSAYAQLPPQRYPMDMISGYEVLRRFKPDKSDPIDQIIVQALKKGGVLTHEKTS